MTVFSPAGKKSVVLVSGEAASQHNTTLYLGSSPELYLLLREVRKCDTIKQAGGQSPL